MKINGKKVRLVSAGLVIEKTEGARSYRVWIRNINSGTCMTKDIMADSHSEAKAKVVEMVRRQGHGVEVK